MEENFIEIQGNKYYYQGSKLEIYDNNTISSLENVDFKNF